MKFKLDFTVDRGQALASIERFIHDMNRIFAMHPLANGFTVEMHMDQRETLLRNTTLNGIPVDIQISLLQAGLMAMLESGDLVGDEDEPKIVYLRAERVDVLHRKN